VSCEAIGVSDVRLGLPCDQYDFWIRVWLLFEWGMVRRPLALPCLARAIDDALAWPGLADAIFTLSFFFCLACVLRGLGWLRIVVTPLRDSD
jgi:hypothetical protein